MTPFAQVGIWWCEFCWMGFQVLSFFKSRALALPRRISFLRTALRRCPWWAYGHLLLAKAELEYAGSRRGDIARTGLNAAKVSIDAARILHSAQSSRRHFDMDRIESEIRTAQKSA